MFAFWEGVYVGEHEFTWLCVQLPFSGFIKTLGRGCVANGVSRMEYPAFATEGKCFTSKWTWQGCKTEINGRSLESYSS